MRKEKRAQIRKLINQCKSGKVDFRESRQKEQGKKKKERKNKPHLILVIPFRVCFLARVLCRSETERDRLGV